MPMRRNFRSIRATYAQYELRPVRAGVASHGCQIASLDDRRPLQIAEVHDFGWRRAFFLFLAANSDSNYQEPDERCARYYRSIFLHLYLLRRNGATCCAKDTLRMAGEQYAFTSPLFQSQSTRVQDS